MVAGVDDQGGPDGSGTVPYGREVRPKDWKPWKSSTGSNGPFGCTANSTVVVCRDTAGAYQALSAVDGRKLWRLDTQEQGGGAGVSPTGQFFMPSDSSRPTVYGDMVFMASGDRLLGVDAATGETRWQQRAGGAHTRSAGPRCAVRPAGPARRGGAPRPGDRRGRAAGRRVQGPGGGLGDRHGPGHAQRVSGAGKFRQRRRHRRRQRRRPPRRRRQPRRRREHPRPRRGHPGGDGRDHGVGGPVPPGAGARLARRDRPHTRATACPAALASAPRPASAPRAGPPVPPASKGP
ncbi:PQQ-binding-like beta-propeller repeat protein [Streptomyces sp. NPDC048496]|uniref:outer membrane protein assembly factor BamB family protein n=1 Tax=Streptomyces sp. NPDC048496 TaxID=3365558 RepID=UPI00371CB063